MVVLDDVALGDTAIPYVAALDGALRRAGMWDDETWMLAGLTGLAFHLIVDRKTCPSSPTAYDWTRVHSAAAERIGVRSRSVECVADVDAYPARRDDAVAMIKAALDDGRPAVVRTVDWAEFAIVTGYDDADGVLFYDSRHADPVLYDNLGSPHGFPFLFAQTFAPGEGAVLADAVRSSLEYSVVCWRGPGFPKHKLYDYEVGAAGYAALIRALESGDTDPLGLRYILKIHADARRSLVFYLDHVAAMEVLPGLDPVAAAYREVAPLATEVSELLPAAPPFERPLDAEAADAIRLLRSAADLEAEAMAALERSLASATAAG